MNQGAEAVTAVAEISKPIGKHDGVGLFAPRSSPAIKNDPLGLHICDALGWPGVATKWLGAPELPGAISLVEKVTGGNSADFPWDNLPCIQTQSVGREKILEVGSVLSPPDQPPHLVSRESHYGKLFRLPPKFEFRRP